MPSETTTPSTRGGWRVATPARVAALLALPYLIAIVALRGLQTAMPTFHGGDEGTYHLPTILGFARQLPGVDLVDYPAAQTPLYHLLVAGWGELVGLELWKLRIVGVVASYAMVLVLYRLLRRHSGLAAWPAAALAALFGLSPYVFGPSFILLTDNLSLLFALLAIERLLAYQRTARGAPVLGIFAAACGWIALTLLTRQSYVWLGLLGLAVLVLRARLDRRQAFAGIGLLALAAVPFGVLVLVWGGLVPKGGDPASCGLCSPEEGRLGWRDDSPLRAPLFVFAVLGLYGTMLHAAALWDALRAGAWRGRAWVAPAVAALAGAVALLVIPLSYDIGDEGYLWRVSRWAPELLGSSLLFWLLIPLGCALLVVGVRREGWRSLPVLIFVTFLVAQLATRLLYQKYFDPFVLLVLLLMLRPQQLRTRAGWLGPIALLALSLGYLVAFAMGWIAVES